MKNFIETNLFAVVLIGLSFNIVIGWLLSDKKEKK